MGSLSNLKDDGSVQVNEETDSLGGFKVLDTDVYEFEIEAAFVTKSDKDAMALNVHLKYEKSTVRAQFWMTSNKEKGCKTTYTTKKGETFHLPGYNQANALSLLTTGKPIFNHDTEIKSIKLYDHNAGKEVPTDVEMVMPLMGKKILAAVFSQVVDRKAKNEQTGDYEPTGDVREENEVDKFFRVKDKLTKVEILAKQTEPKFMNDWLDKWKGVVRDKTDKSAKKGKAGAAGRPTGNAAPTENLFE
jgi:hypothetical protein